MKIKTTAILFLAFIAGAANAEVFAIASTKAVGQIRLTNESSNCPDGSKFFYIRTADGEVLPGCWRLLDGEVLATFKDGLIRLYSLDGFTMKQTAKSGGVSL